MENQNTPEYLQKHLVQLIENLRNIEHAPNVASFQRPPDHYTADQEEDEDDIDPDIKQLRDDRHVYDPRELFDDDDKRYQPERDRMNYKEKTDKNEKQTHSNETNNNTTGPEVMDGMNNEHIPPHNNTIGGSTMSYESGTPHTPPPHPIPPTMNDKMDVDN
eukprot:TRINITY_DN4560_c0_g2_i1.p1 TRINITY_DN4560_c0_g2~~TRINITY_DN4560_c0_g2_i1.p1  ORF type:complete len:174 (-),score=50.22 TRINITY_DN4560_c0_g2_i1:13-495(-)